MKPASIGDGLRWRVVRVAYRGCRGLPAPKGKGRLLRLLERVVRSDRGPIRFDLGQRMFVELSDHIEGSIYRHGAYEREVTAAFCSLVNPGSTVLDVGAHIGYYTLLGAARVGSLGSVHAFEPVPEIFERLRANVMLNGYRNVSLNRLALSTEEGFVHIYPAIGRNSATSSILPSGENAPIPIKVASTTIDAYVKEQCVQQVDLVKLDVEGAELFVLRGGEQTLASQGPDVIVEIGNSLFQQAGYDLSTVLDFMTSLGYQPFRIENPQGTFTYAYFSRRPKLSLPPWA